MFNPLVSCTKGPGSNPGLATMEQRREVKNIIVKQICDECGKGEMKYQGMVLTSWPAQYPHVCPKCGHTARYGCIYPKIEYGEVSQ